MASPELLEWCRRGGVQWAGIEAGFVAEGWRGVLATEDIPAGTCILRVPRRLLMSVESARRDPQLAAALAAVEPASSSSPLTSEQILAAHLLHECFKGASSFWHPYLRSLPRHYSTAMCFGEAEAAALQAPHAVAAARAAAAAAAAQHAGALPLLRALGLAPSWRSRGAWLWAASTLSSRTMYLPDDSAGALTPFGDLHNYRAPPPPITPALAGLAAAASALAAAGGAAGGAGTPAGAAAAQAGGGPAGAAAGGEPEEGLAGDGRLDAEADEYCIQAGVGYARGQQVFLCYGRHTNLELLLHYGFVLEENAHDTAALPPGLLPATVRQQLAADSGGSGSSSDAHAAAAGDGDGAYLHANGAPSWALLRALRLGSAAPAERKASAYLALADRPISVISERAAFTALRAACDAALAALPTTAAQDEEQLAALSSMADAPQQQQPADAAECERQQQQQQQQQAAERLQVAAQWRLCHKRILQRGVALCDAVLAALPSAAPAAAADVAGRLAALQRKPRW